MRPALPIFPMLQDRLEKNDVRYRFVIDIQGSLVA